MYARKLRYGAHDGESGASYMALIELAKKKSGEPVKFVLYQRVIQYNYPSESITQMVSFEVATAEEAIRRFWPWDGGTGKEFPGWESDQWETTTLWLDVVAAGGWYERFDYCHDEKGVRLGRWVKVGTPSPWKKRHKKKPLRFGFPAHIILVDEARIRTIEEDISDLRFELNVLESYYDGSDESYVPEENREEYRRVEGKIETLRDEIASIRAKIKALREKMRLEVRQKFPTPAGLTPKRVIREALKSRGSVW